MKPHFFALAGISVCGALFAHAAPAPTFVPIASEAPHATNFASLAYFNQNCARCHGEYGSFYGKDFGHDKTDAQLRAIVDEMAQGPGGAPLNAHDLDVLVSWHRALRDAKPFVAITSAKPDASGWQLEGEISPGSTLQINGEAVEVKGANWTYRATTKNLELRAQKDDAFTELNANAAAWAP